MLSGGKKKKKRRRAPKENLTTSKKTNGKHPTETIMLAQLFSNFRAYKQ